MGKHVTKKQAEAAVKALREQFASAILPGDDGPKLFEPGFHATGWTVGWEEGPYEWPFRAFEGGFDEEVYAEALEFGAEFAERVATTKAVARPAGVLSEPVNGWCLALYPA